MSCRSRRWPIYISSVSRSDVVVVVVYSVRFVFSVYPSEGGRKRNGNSGSLGVEAVERTLFANYVYICKSGSPSRGGGGGWW